MSRMERNSVADGSVVDSEVVTRWYCNSSSGSDGVASWLKKEYGAIGNICSCICLCCSNEVDDDDDVACTDDMVAGISASVVIVHKMCAALLSDGDKIIVASIVLLIV
jgi:hypothetical protein